MIEKLCTRAGLLALFSLCSSESVHCQDLAIAHANVYPAPDAPVRKDVTLLIRHGEIAAVGANLPIPKDVKTLACQSCFVFAGFWNAHVHFMEPKWNDAAHQPAEQLTRQMSDMVTHSGFSTVIDCGSDGENTVELRRRVAAGEVLGPRIFTAGIPLFPAHALPYYLDALPAELRNRMAQPESAQEATAIVDRNRAAGYDIVKLFTGSIVQPNHIVPMNLQIARAAVMEAHKYGQPVFAHTTNPQGTRVAVDAGVDVLAHTPEVTEGIDEALMRRMLAQHMTMIPTLKLFSRDDNIADIRRLAYRYHQLGGRMVYGTDTGFLPDYDQGEEFRQLSQAGFNFRDVLAMLTTAPVQLMHLSRHEGKVMPGMRGDLTVLKEDPGSGRPEAFTSVAYTIKGGNVIWRAN